MTSLKSKLTLAVCALAVAGLFTMPSLRAADDKGGAGKSDKKGKVDENLRKYDRNGNGKLDPDEEAAMKADQEKAKAKKK